MGVKQLQQETGARVRWTPFPLHPDTPEEGLELKDLFAGRAVDLGAMRARLREVARELGVPLGDRERTFNSRRAQELGVWAETLGRGDAFRDAVYRAYFVEGRNIALPGELTRLAEDAGLPADEARIHLERSDLAGTVDEAWRRARSLGVTAVPTHRCGARQEAGLLPYPALRRFYERCAGGAVGAAGKEERRG